MDHLVRYETDGAGTMTEKTFPNRLDALQFARHATKRGIAFPDVAMISAVDENGDPAYCAEITAGEIENERIGPPDGWDD